MPPATGEITRQAILRAAEHLFAEHGFDRTSVDRIARRAKVNKALIFYHFRTKDGLIGALFEKMIEEIDAAPVAPIGTVIAPSMRELLRTELDRTAARRRILAVMVMEALKSKRGSEALFQCGLAVIRREHPELSFQLPSVDAEARKALLAEFFTGFIPFVLFATLQDGWCTHTGCSANEAREHFVDTFLHSHVER